MLFRSADTEDDGGCLELVLWRSPRFTDRLCNIRVTEKNALMLREGTVGEQAHSEMRDLHNLAASLLTHLVPELRWIRALQEPSLGANSNLYCESGRVPTVQQLKDKRKIGSINIERERPVQPDVGINPRALGCLELLGSGIGSTLGSISRLLVSAVHEASENRINSQDSENQQLQNKFGFPEVSLKSCLKIAKISFHFCCALVFMAVGLVHIQSMATVSKRHFTLFLMIGIICLFVGMIFVFMGCTSIMTP